MAKDSGEKWFVLLFIFLIVSEISVQSHLVFSFGACGELEHYLKKTRNWRTAHLMEAEKYLQHEERGGVSINPAEPASRDLTSSYFTSPTSEKFLHLPIAPEVGDQAFNLHSPRVHLRLKPQEL